MLPDKKASRCATAGALVVADSPGVHSAVQPMVVWRPSQALGGFQPPGPDRLHELLRVSLVLVGVTL